MRKSTVFLSILALFILAAVPADALHLNIQHGDSGPLGHYYYLLTYDDVAGNSGSWEVDDKSWDTANNWVSSFGNSNLYLATITSAEEQAFVENWLKEKEVDGEYWLGGYQDPSEEPDQNAGWSWVTGETWSYQNWYRDEPNDAGVPGKEQYLAMWDNFNWQWNDEGNLGNIAGMIIEYGKPVPEPATLMLLGIGLVGLGYMRKKSIKK